VPTSQLSKFAATLVSLVLFSGLAAAQYKIGSGNTATADPPVPHPATTPCKVQLFSQFKFDNFNPQSFNYAPPSDCPGPWAKIILQADFSITKGIQYDRTANIWIGPVNIYFGTTAEDDPSDARSWHIERDLTEYSTIFTTDEVGTVDLFNLYDKQYNGLLHGSADVLFYPLAQNQAPPRTADQVIGFSAGPTGGTVALDTTGTCQGCQLLLEDTLTLPTNITDLYFDVFAQSQHNDEFWYTCVPNDVAGELESCPNTAFRESEVTIDGTPAGVAPVYPWIFTGGIDPLLWIPIPGVQTLNFQPYRVNLTPFAAVLNDGQPHTIALSVYDADNYFSATASLLLYLDSGSTQVTGALTNNTLTAPSPNITENIHIAKNGNLNGTVSTRSGHDFQISGYVNTSLGTVTTTVAQDINFSNIQNFKIIPAFYEQDINQNTTVHSVVTTQNNSGTFVENVNRNWPFKMDIAVQYNSDGSGVQTTTSNQYFELDSEGKHKGQITSFTLLENRVISTDALDFNSSGQISGNQDQSSLQNFFSSDSSGYCYSRELTAANNVLTSVTNGRGCN